MKKIEIKKNSQINNERCRPLIFNFTNFRPFLLESLNYIQKNNPSYSATAFCRQAGFGENSRGYFNLILNGKRNLSSKTILGFSLALKLNKSASHYFENLVHYNQAKAEKEKSFYFKKVSQYLKGNNVPAYELLKSQYNYFTNWYLVAIRELVALDDFQYNAEWIVKKLKNKITKNQAVNSIKELITLGLLQESKDQLIQTNKLVKFSDNSLNYTVVNNIHRELLKDSLKSLDEESYDNRSNSCILLATDDKNFSKIRDEIRDFREILMQKYGQNNSKINSVLKIGFQINYITSPQKSRNRDENQTPHH